MATFRSFDPGALTTSAKGFGKSWLSIQLIRPVIHFFNIAAFLGYKPFTDGSQKPKGKETLVVAFL